MFRFFALVLSLAVTVCARADTVDVFVFNNQFSVNQPGQPIQHPVITIGDTVRWVWIQGNHTTTSVVGSPEQWDAPITQSNQTFSHTFTTIGTFWYYCIPHGFDNGDGTASGMAGTVTVLAPGMGACCLPQGCEITSPADCLALGGVYQGDGTGCTPDPCGTGPVTIELVADRDNVLYQTPDGSLSNALGRFMFAGNNNSGERRRGLVRFDTGSIPPGSTVIDAEVRLFCSQSQGQPAAVTLKRLLADWGEGNSAAGGNEGNGAPATPGDATWLHRFFPHEFWATPGGDFVQAPSASVVVSSQGVFYSWSSASLADDVQVWVGDSEQNFGWIIVGDEVGNGNTKRFNSKDSPMGDNHPRLVVTYLPPARVGACCFSDGSCDELTEADCAALGGTYMGDLVACADVLCTVVLEPFVDELPRPAVAQPTTGVPGGAAHYDIAMTEQFQRLHRDLPQTRVWGYAGTYPGPTIEARRGEPVTVTWINDLRVFETGELRTAHALVVDECLHGPDVTGQTPVAVVHLHGGKVGPESDGYPEDAFPPGQQSPLYVYPNNQPAATLWYHDHALGITRLNVMMGMAGYYIIRDDLEEALGLPSGDYEVPLAIQDRTFRADGSLVYPEMWHEHFFGDTILVNGKVWPYLEVDQGKYRFRVLNGSNSRAYTLSLSDGAGFWQIATDLGLLEAPVPLQSLTLLPGERADVVIDFAGYDPGDEIVLVNSAPAPFPGLPGVGVVPDVMKFIVAARPGHTAPLPTALVDVPRLDPQDAVIERVLDLRTMPNMHCPHHHDPVWTIDGRMWDDITEFPLLWTTEIWTWRNNSGISHPMHMHLVMAQILDRQAIDEVTGLPTGPRIPPAPGEAGWKDTVDAPPGYYTRVIVRFEDFTGIYPYHCHILEHEDHEMMRQFEVIACAADLNRDGVVDADDFFLFLSLFAAGDPRADMNKDGVIDADDFFVFLALFAAGC
ncbi:MAG: DNRLRE domain-containing protein [Phycisphaerales bacterium]|nr:MAG: DNRLRE domain-containing protein [Phycisphaerales bacterium]